MAEGPLALAALLRARHAVRPSAGGQDFQVGSWPTRMESWLRAELDRGQPELELDQERDQSGVSRRNDRWRWTLAGGRRGDGRQASGPGEWPGVSSRVSGISVKRTFLALTLTSAGCTLIPRLTCEILAPSRAAPTPVRPRASLQVC